MNISWGTSKEENILFLCLANFRQLLKVPHLANWDTPTCQEIFMEVVLCVYMSVLQ